MNTTKPFPDDAPKRHMLPETPEPYACRIYQDGEEIYHAQGHGVLPLLRFLDVLPAKPDGAQRVLVDRIVGKAAVLLAARAQIDAIFTPTTTERAIRTAEAFGLPLHFSRRVAFLENRDRTGRCPFEQAVVDIEDPKVGEQALRATLARLRS